MVHFGARFLRNSRVVEFQLFRLDCRKQDIAVGIGGICHICNVITYPVIANPTLPTETITHPFGGFLEYWIHANCRNVNCIPSSRCILRWTYRSRLCSLHIGIGGGLDPAGRRRRDDSHTGNVDYQRNLFCHRAVVVANAFGTHDELATYKYGCRSHLDSSHADPVGPNLEHPKIGSEMGDTTKT